MTATPLAAPPATAPQSPNFHFLAAHSPLLVRYAAQAERYLFDDPSTALVKLRQFAELLARLALAEFGVEATPQDEFAAVLALLRDRRVANGDVLDLFHGIRKAGNAAAHEGRGERSDALHHLRMARQLAVWFHRAFGTNPALAAGPFVPPPDPAHATQELHRELDRLRQVAAEQARKAEEVSRAADDATTAATREAEARRLAEEAAARAYAELTAAFALAEETSAQLAQERRAFEERLAEVQAAAAGRPAEQTAASLAKVQHAAALIDLDEAATRKLIDQQLRDAGWEADSESLTFKKGARPQKGKNLAIAEWPTDGGPADYVLFTDLTPVAAVEAKKAVKDVPARSSRPSGTPATSRPTATPRRAGRGASTGCRSASPPTAGRSSARSRPGAACGSSTPAARPTWPGRSKRGTRPTGCANCSRGTRSPPTRG